MQLSDPNATFVLLLGTEGKFHCKIKHVKLFVVVKVDILWNIDLILSKGTGHQTVF